MGKFNNSIDIIPIASSSFQSHQGISKKKHSMNNKVKKNHRDLMPRDPMLIPRVKRYLEDNLDQTYVDVSSMITYLRGNYTEYGRRKESPFRVMVESAYKHVLRDYGIDDVISEDGGDRGSGSDDLQMMETENNHNRLNDCLQNMYNKQNNASRNQKPNKSSAESTELIDIIDSSDEEEELIEKMKSSASESTTKQLLSRLPGTTMTKCATSIPLQQARDHSREKSLPPNTNSQNIVRKRKAGETSENSVAKKKRSEGHSLTPIITFKDVGGIDNILKDLCDMLLHIKHPEVYRHLGTQPPRGFLLHGPPGCGKTLLANAIAGKLEIPLISVVSTELVAGVSGESEERIREIFDQALALAPCVLFIDEVDIISSNRANAQKDMERRIVSQLISCMDGLGTKEKGDQVLVIGATNRADALDPSLRRVGRFDQEICLGIPDRKARVSILKIVCQNLSLEPDFDYDHLAQVTPGYVGADLLALSSKAAANAVKRVFYELKQQRSQSPQDIVDVDEHEKIILLDRDDNEEESNKNNSANVIDVDQTINLDDDDKVESTDDKVDKSLVNGTSDESSVRLDKSSDEVTILADENEEKTKPDSTDDKTDAEIAPKSTDDKQEEKNESEVTEKGVDQVEDTVDTEEVEKMSVASVNSDKIKKIETVKDWTLEEMEAWLDDPEPPLNINQLQSLRISMEDFELALKTIQPSAKREGFITIPGVTWDEIGSLRDIRSELQMAILAPVRYPDRLLALGLNAPSGVLLCGPPGCGKTLLAKAIANEAGINFISVKGPELLNMYVGESERAVRQCFTRARNSAPCVIFFDEFDSLCPKRSGGSEGGVSSRVVNQLLTEMDGVEGRAGVFLMAATNRPDIVDPAVMRPGRLDKILYVGLPNASDRLEILQAVTKNGTKPVLHSDVDLSAVANSQACAGYTGADLAGLVRQASMQALRESMTQVEPVSNLCVTQKHFLQALASIRPSVSSQDQKHYETLRKKYAVTLGDTYEPMDDS